MQRQELRDPALGGVQRLDPLLRGGAEQREPQAAVGSEALLRREVVGVGLGDVDGQPAGAGGGVDRDERSIAPPAGRRTGTITPVEVSLCAHAIRSAPPSAACRRRGRRVGGVAGVGGHHDGSSRNGAPSVTGANFWENSPKRQVRGAALDEPERGGVPEGGGAAVAERDLVAVGQREQLAQAGADLADERLHGLLAVGGAHHRGALAREARERLRADLRGAAAEAPVGGLQLVGDDQRRLLCQGCCRHVGSSLSRTSREWLGSEGAQARGGATLVTSRW